MVELEDPLGNRQVPQPMSAEVLQRGAIRQPATDERGGGRRDEDLPAVGQRPQAGTSVDVRAAVVLARLARVEGGADLDRGALRPGLAPDRQLDREPRRDGAACHREDREEAVPLAALGEHRAAVLADVLGQQLVVANKGCAHVRLAGFPVARGPLDVGKQERDVAGRDGHRGSMAEVAAAGEELRPARARAVLALWRCSLGVRAPALWHRWLGPENEGRHPVRVSS